MSNEPNIAYVLSISWLPLAEPWRITATIAAGGLSGGITSTMAGGDFWEGVCNGLISSGLNHAMHLVAEGGSPDDPPGTEKNKNIPKAPDGAKVHSAKRLFFKTFMRYQVGALDKEDFWVDASTLEINETDLVYREEYGDYVVNLFGNGKSTQGLALGHLVLNKVGEYDYTINEDVYDFHIESYRSFAGNAATVAGWAVHNLTTPLILPKGTFTIRFAGVVTVKH